MTYYRMEWTARKFQWQSRAWNDIRNGSITILADNKETAVSTGRAYIWGTVLRTWRWNSITINSITG